MWISQHFTYDTRLVAIDPCVAKGITSPELFDKALPEVVEMQYRDIPRFVVIKAAPSRLVTHLATKFGARESINDLKILNPLESVRKRGELRLDEDEGICVVCSRPGALHTCPSCQRVVHFACSLCKSPVVAPLCKNCKANEDLKVLSLIHI